MAILNTDLYMGSDLYSDGNIEDHLLELAKEYGEYIPDDKIDNFTTAYHFSPIRENIINWYPFKKNCSILEIGSGCGAITGCLCRVAKRVISVELSKKRATINYLRHKQYNNLEIVVANFNDFLVSERFDYVILNGVFEYSGLYTSSKDPFLDFLKYASDFLKVNGKILIAIENRLGLKYFNGSKEDHLNGFFTGINDYPELTGVRTFTKSEWKRMLLENHLRYYKFYYPYPDYKFPNEIFDDETILTMGYGKSYLNFEEGRLNLFDEESVIKSLTDEEIVGSFANSFLIEASRRRAVLENNVIYAKLNNNRKIEFRIGTKIVKKIAGKEVIKFALAPDASTHISNMCSVASVKDGKFKVLSEHRIDDSAISCLFLKYNSLQKLIAEEMKNDNTDKAIAYCEDAISEFLKGKEIKTLDIPNDKCFVDMFGEVESEKTFDSISNTSLDLIPANIFYHNGTWILIDDEWHTEAFVPVNFIIWRMLNECRYDKLIENSEKFYTEACKKFDISNADIEIFRKMANHFADEYVGTGISRKIVKLITTINLAEYNVNTPNGDIFRTSFYLDYGDGFSEENKLTVDTKISNYHFTVDVQFDKYKHSKELVQIRWDPVEFKRCILSNLSFSSNLVLPADFNAEEWVITDDDPQTNIKVQGEYSNAIPIKIEGIIHF